MTIPKLRRAFESLDAFLQRKIKSPTIESEFRKEWRKLFGKPVSEEAAKDYIAYVKSIKTPQKGGGAPLSGAPIDFMLRQGAPAPDNAVPYVASGFGFANVPSFSPTQCGKEDSTPVLRAGFGTNTFPGAIVGGGKRKTRKQQKGGALPGFLNTMAEMAQRPLMMSSPPNGGQDLQMGVKGVNLVSGDPVSNPLKFVESRPALEVRTTLP
jgi:hypothetical protein